MTLYKAGRQTLAALLIANPAASTEAVWDMCRQVVDGLCNFAVALRLDDDNQLRRYLETDAAYVRERHSILQNGLKTGAFVASREDTQVAHNLMAAYGMLPAAPAAVAAIEAPEPAPAAAVAPEGDAAAA